MNSVSTTLRRMLLIIATLQYAVPGNAYNFAVENEDGVTIYYNMNDEGVEVTYKNLGKDYSGSVTIPSSVFYNGVEYIVNAVSGSAFSQCRTLTSVIISETVTSIGANAFDGCVLLKSVQLPPNLVSIEDGTFVDCYNLEGIEIPSSVVYVGTRSFSDCRSLQSITIPSSVQAINTQAFYGCDKLEKVVSLIKQPFTIDYLAFSNKENATLYVPSWTSDLYRNAKGWDFANIRSIGGRESTTPYALWCNVNNTLYFLSSDDLLTEGDVYQGQVVSKVWSDQEITDTGTEEPKWCSIVKGTMKKVIFDQTFGSSQE